MCLLNGECGGLLPASVTFSSYDVLDANGAYQTEQPTIYTIIKYVVNYFGGEQLPKILISDVDERVRKVMKWTGSNPLYITQYTSTTSGVQYGATTDKEQVDEALAAERLILIQNIRAAKMQDTFIQILFIQEN